MGAAVKLPEQVDLLENRIRPIYSREALEEALDALRTRIPLEIVFGHPAADHRATLRRVSEMLTDLNCLGKQMQISATEYPDIARALESELPAACDHLRTLRALIGLTLADQSIVNGETPGIVERARNALREREERLLARMSKAERKNYLDDKLADPAELDAWLAEP